MARKRRDQRYEPIEDLFGDVVQDGPARLYGSGGALPGPETGPPGGQADRRDPRFPPPPGAAPASAGRRDASPEFVDDRGLLSAVVILHGALTALTLGLYGFWLKTHQRRVIWSHTRLEGEPLEYAGRGWELLLGALLALVFIAGLLGAVHLAALFAGHFTGGGFGAAQAGAAGLVGAAALAALVPYAAFMSRRYRLSRTRWRGVRFGMEGRALGMVGLWALWMPAVVASLGLLWPLWRWARERRLSRAMRWGSEPFGFEGSGLPLLLRWLPVWLSVAGAAGLAAAPEMRAAAAAGAAAAPGLAALGAGAAALLLWLFWLNYRAAEIRLAWNARRLAGVRAQCGFGTGALLDGWLAVLRRNVWPGLLVYLLLAAVTAIPIFAAMRVEIESPATGSLLPDGAEGLAGELFGDLRNWRSQALVLLALGVNGLVASVFAMWLWMAVHARILQANLCASLRLSGVEGLDAVRQRADDASLQAEGMADALDAAGA